MTVSTITIGRKGAVVPFWGPDGDTSDLVASWPPWDLINIGPWGPFVGFAMGVHGDKEIDKITTTGDATPVSRSGRYPADVQVELWIWRRKEYDLYCQMIPGLYRLKAAGRAVRVYHPALAIIVEGGAMALSFKRSEILQAPRTGGKGVTHLHFSEWLPTNGKNKTDSQAITSADFPHILSEETFRQLSAGGIPPAALIPPNPPDPADDNNGPYDTTPGQIFF